MTTDPRIDELTKRLLRPDSVEAVRATLVRIDELSDDHELRMQVGFLFSQAFQCLRELTASDLELTSSVLLNDLLPRCLVPNQDRDEHRFSSLFEEWIDELPEENRYAIRQTAISHALAALDGASVRSALRLIGSIGYWDSELLSRLERLIGSHDNETGDHSLMIRAWLAPTPQSTPELLTELHRRIALRRNVHLSIHSSIDRYARNCRGHLV
jgi:hypothetical protein